MIKKLLFIAFILLNAKVLVAQSGAPTITNFQIEPSTPNRIYFDSSESITASTTSGFDLKDHEGISISGITINSGQLSGHYFTVSSDFKWYHNNTFDYDGGSNIQGEGGIALNKFDLQYIKNNIPVPAVSGTEFYVDASIASSGNGLSETSAFKTIQEGVNALSNPGDKLWIKAGNYGAESVVLGKSGTADNAIQIEGYKNTIGDITSMYYSYGNTTGIENGGNPLIVSEMPLLDGGVGSRKTGFRISGNNSFVIVKNIQIKNYEIGVSLGSNCSKIILENIIGKDMGGESNSNGSVFNLNKFSFDTHYTKLINCVAINGTEDNITVGGNNNLVENCKTYCDRGNIIGKIGLPTDYYIKLRGRYNIVRNSLVNRLSKGHNGHGFSLKKLNEYTLVEHCEAINILWALQARHSVSNNNVFRDCEVHANVPYRFSDATSGGINLMSGSHNNVFENIYFHDLDKVFVFEKNVEDNANSSDIGHDNIFKNIIINNINRSVFYFRNFQLRQTTFNNNKFYNLTLNNVKGGLFEIRKSSSGIVLNNNELKNCVFKDVPNLYLINRNNRALEPNEFTWDYNNFYNGFPIQGNNTTIVDPKFVNSSSGDFKLQETSELIDSGIELGEVASDFGGEARPRGNGYDIGAFEDQSDVPGAGADVTICDGSSTTLTASGIGDFLWDTGETTQSITVSPSSTTTYSVTVTDGNSEITDSVLVTVNELPTADAGLDVEVCYGTEVVLTANGGDTYLWNTGETTESITVSPTETTIYEVTTTNDGCTTTAEDEVVVTVNQMPNLNAGEDVEICIGNSITLTATGSDTYLWSTGEETETITVNPTETTTYSVTYSLGDCSVSDDIIVTVNNPPSISLGNDETICYGESITLTASGEGDFLWSTGETTSSITVNPLTTTTYSITASSSCDLIGVSDEIIIDVTPEIILDAGVDVAICEGENITLTASGNNNFLWNTGETTSSITVNPTATTTYSVSSSMGNCLLSDDVIVTVEVPPSVSLGEDISICSGESVTLTAEGNGNFVWSTGETTSSITVNTSTTKTYSVTASSSCNTGGVTDEIIINVIPEIILDAGEDVIICQGENIVLTALGSDNYEWSTGETTASITVNPTATTTYTVITSSGNCSFSDEVIVTVDSQPSVSLGPDLTMCSEETIVLTASGNGNFLWSTGETTSSISVSPSTTTVYSVTANSSCTMNNVSDEIVVTVNDLPEVNVGDDVTIELGASIILTATGEGNFLWSTGEITPSITVSPSITTTYTVVATLESGGCSNDDSIIITVEGSIDNDDNNDNDEGDTNDDTNDPLLEHGFAGPDVEICTNSTSTILTATGGEYYLWDTGETTASITVSPTETLTYSVARSVNGVTDADDVTVFVNEECSGIVNRITSVKEVLIYPNPTDGILNIELNGFNDELSIALFSLNGSLVYSEKITNSSPDKILKRQIDLTRFSKGIYFVRLTNKDDVRTKKVLVI